MRGKIRVNLPDAMESPEAPHHHASHTGHRWFDIALGVSAMFVSVVTLFVAIELGRTMERMADANNRMVEANSWPFVAFDTHNLNEKGVPQVRLVLTNEGIGPARIETFELWWKGKPISSPGQLLKSCCATSPDPQQNQAISIGLASPRILRAGEDVDFLALDPHESRPVRKLQQGTRLHQNAHLLLLSVRRMLDQPGRCGGVPAGSAQGDSSRTCECLPEAPGSLRTCGDAVALRPARSLEGTSRCDYHIVCRVDPVLEEDFECIPVCAVLLPERS